MLYSSGWDDLASNRWGQNLVADSVPAEHPIHHQNCRLRRSNSQYENRSHFWLVNES